MSKTDEVKHQVEALMAEGVARADAFKQIAETTGAKVNTVRGQYYAHRSGASSRPRRRETTPGDAFADARAVLERSIATIDLEVEQARIRMTEAKAEHDSLKATATERKQAINTKLDALS